MLSITTSSIIYFNNSQQIFDTNIVSIVSSIIKSLTLEVRGYQFESHYGIIFFTILFFSINEIKVVVLYILFILLFKFNGCYQDQFSNYCYLKHDNKSSLYLLFS